MPSIKDGLGETLFKALQTFDKRILQFLDDTDGVNTFSDILTRSVRTAIKLKKEGISRGDIVSSCTHNYRDSCIPFIAAQFLGAIPATFDEKLSHLDTIHLLKIVQPKIIFVSENILEFMETCLHKANVNTRIVVFGSSEKYSEFSNYLEPCKDEEHFYPVQIENENDTAVIVFSSGTTGLPKGICLHHSMLTNGANNPTIYEKKHILLTYASLYWISGIGSFIRCICNGYSLVTCKRYDPTYCWELIEKYKVTLMFLAPYDAHDFLNQQPKKVNTSSLEVLLLGGCPVSKKLMESLEAALPQTKIINVYGSSEATGAASFNSMIDEEYKMQLLKPTSCGKISSNFKLKVVDINSEQVLGTNEKGEIRIKGQNVMKKYYKMDSSAAFDLDGYLKTGDLGYVDEDDCLYIDGRIKEMFKYRGWHINPTLIEEVLKSHPAVKEVAVVGVPHEIDVTHPMGFVVLNKAYDRINKDDLVSFVNERVSEKQQLRAGITIVNNIPKTVTGKTKRLALDEIVSNTLIQ